MQQVQTIAVEHLALPYCTARPCQRLLAAVGQVVKQQVKSQFDNRKLSLMPPHSILAHAGAVNAGRTPLASNQQHAAGAA
jgi:hypothetical protein